MHLEGAVRNTEYVLQRWDGIRRSLNRLKWHTRLKTQCLSPQRSTNGDEIGSMSIVLGDVFAVLSWGMTPSFEG